jgi:hypothetical protein
MAKFSLKVTQSNACATHRIEFGRSFFKFYRRPISALLSAATQKVVQIFEKTKAYQKVGARVWKPTDHCKASPGSEKYWKCFVNYYAGSGTHGCTTAPMGKFNDPTAVLDSQLRFVPVAVSMVIIGLVF